MAAVELQNAELCRACGGFCCKSYPGISAPKDWCDPIDEKVMLEKLTTALQSGLWTVDWWESDPRGRVAKKHRVYRGYFIRPAVKGDEGKKKHPLWGGGECALLGKTGCRLRFEERPIECRLLMPQKDFPNCKFPPGADGKLVGKQALAVAWIPYHAVIEAAYKAAAGQEL